MRSGADNTPRQSAAGRAPTPAVVSAGGGYVAGFAGGVAALVLVGAAVVGITVGTRTAHLFAGIEADLATALTAQLDAKLRSTARQVAADLASAQDAEDWDQLQAELPRLAAADPTLLRVLVTDEDGLVLADSDPEKNGRPLDDRALLALLRCSELGEKVVVDTGQVDRPDRALGRRVPTEDGRARTVMVVGSARTAVDLGVLLRRKESDALRTAWWMVALGGLISILVAVGVVLVAGSSIARRLRVVAWRVAQLGRSDRGTHVRLDGPAELQNVGRELELAAERLAVASELGQEEERRSAEQRGRRAIVDAALTAERTLQAVSVALVGEPDPRSAPALATVRRADGTVAVLFIERMGASLVDAVAAAELRSAGLALLASDGAMGPSALLARLDALAMPGQRARATALSITAKRQVTVASAGARFPALHHGDAVRPVVVRGDRVGELGAERRPEATITLEEGDRLVLSCEQHASGTPLTVVVTV